MSSRSPHPLDRRITDAAQELLRDGGYAALRDDVVAARTGVQAMVVWARFPTRRSLAEGVLDRLVADAVSGVTDLVDWRAALDRVVIDGGAALVRLLLAGADDDDVADSIEAHLVEPLRCRLREVLPGRVAPADADALFATVWGSVLVRALLPTVVPERPVLRLAS